MLNYFLDTLFPSQTKLAVRLIDVQVWMKPHMWPFFNYEQITISHVHIWHFLFYSIQQFRCFLSQHIALCCKFTMRYFWARKLCTTMTLLSAQFFYAENFLISSCAFIILWELWRMSLLKILMTRSRNNEVKKNSVAGFFW